MKRQSAYAPLCTIMLVVAGQIAGCKSDSPATPVAGNGTVNGGTGTVTGGTGTGVSGVGASGNGATAGRNGVSGTGGGGTGVVGGTGGGAGTGASTDLTCATADKTATPAMLAAAAATALLPPAADPTMKGPCAFSSCHDSSAHKAGLKLDGTVPDLNALLVGKAACETSTLKLVDASTGDAGLAKSWLWQKLIAPADSGGVLTTKPDWGTPNTMCMQQSGQAFGLRMPWSNTPDLLVPPEKLQAVRNWICAGAPKP